MFGNERGDKVKPYPVSIGTTGGRSGKLSGSVYRVEKMRYAKTKQNVKSVDDITILIYNNGHITLRAPPPRSS